MNEKHKSTLENFKNILKVKNYSNKSINIYIHYTEKFISVFNKSALQKNLIIKFFNNFRKSSWINKYT